MSSAVQYSQTVAPAMQASAAGDPIAQLPVDQAPPTSNEIQIVNTLFKKHRGDMDVVFEEAKDSILVAVLVIVFSLPQIGAFIKRFLPMAEKSPYILVLVKGFAAMAIFWLVKHFYLSRKIS